MTATVAQIGLGNLGHAIAVNLMAAGHRVRGYRRSSMDAFVAAGGAACASPAEAVAGADLVITCLPEAAALKEVYLAEAGVLAGAAEGLAAFEVSTLPLKSKLAVRDAAAERGVELIDCTISGNPHYIARRTAAIFAGGDKAAFDAWAHVLRDITGKVTWMGPFGTGRLAKFVAFYLVTLHTLAAAEAFELASRGGLDRAAVLEAIAGSNATSAMLESRGALMVDRDYAGFDQGKRGDSINREGADPVPGRGMANRARNVARLAAFAHRLGGAYPLLDAMNRAYGDAVAAGFGDHDIAEVFEYLMDADGGAGELDEVLALIDELD